MRAKPPRPITEPEIAVVRAILERVPYKPISRSTLDAVATLTVVSTCECGCASVGFAAPETLTTPPWFIAGGYGITASGATIEATVMGADDAVLSLGIVPLGHDDGSLPIADSIGAMLPRDRT